MNPETSRFFKIPSTYTKLISIALTAASITHGFSISCINQKTRICSRNKLHLFLACASILSEILRVAIYLEWFHGHVFCPKDSNSVETSMWKQIMMFYFVEAVTIITVIKGILLWRQDEMETLTKACFDFELLINVMATSSIPVHEVYKSTTCGSPNYVSLKSVVIVFIFLGTSLGIPFMGLVLSLWMPCMPPLFTMGMRSCESWGGNGGLSLTIKIILGLFESYNFSAICGPLIYAMLGFLYYPTLLLEAWLKLLQREILNLPSIAVQYRLAQSFSNLTNFVLRTPIMSMILGWAMMAEVTTLYVFMTAQNLPYAVVVYMGAMATNMFILIQVVFRALSVPYLTSRKFARCQGQPRGKWLSKFLRSCSPLKVSVGDGNFFDRLTSLVISNMCLDMLITLLLTEA
ncbi:hypothetical protein Fcan01_00121 [Folsomia candida]|uniref:Gustatory receptor n=1 Tax=Folsomia candida TaxID=158441 RepID=A0A226EZA4_FOLCA|nr:hypothetical protein Fcan01_00121 [Folsomia candida]